VEDVTGEGIGTGRGRALGELAELLVTELKIAAGRTGSVSNVPAFLTGHLRRLWKKEKRQLEEEGKSDAGGAGAGTKVDISQCPDCFGAGMWYPEGFDKRRFQVRARKARSGRLGSCLPEATGADSHGEGQSVAEHEPRFAPTTHAVDRATSRSTAPKGGE